MHKAERFTYSTTRTMLAGVTVDASVRSVEQLFHLLAQGSLSRGTSAATGMRFSTA